MSNKFKLIFIVILICSILIGCSSTKKKLTIGMIPVRDSNQMLDEFQPIKEYLEEQIGISIEVLVTDDYASLVKEMKNGNVDIGWYGAFSYVAAESEMELTPLVVQERKESGLYYQSLIITHKDSGITTIEQLKDKRFAFVDNGSTSGFILPYALFISRDIDFTQYFSKYHYSGSHDQVPIEILNGIVDAGAISSIQFEKLIASGKIKEEDFNVIWQSEDIPGSPYIARSNLDENTKEKFTESMVNIHNVIPEELEKYDDSIEKYVEIDNNIYNSIRNIATILGREYMYEYFLKGE